MAFSLSFSESFYGNPYDCEPMEYPTDVCSAIRSIPDDTWDNLCRDVFDCESDYVDVETVLQKIRETDTCSDLCSPVAVWIDPEGYYTVDVYDSDE